ncbi:MAG TPA: PKD domain-containing protein, partial [Thermoplasmata archaeon]
MARTVRGTGRKRPMGTGGALATLLAVAVVVGASASVLGVGSGARRLSLPGPPSVTISAAPTGGPIPLSVSFSATGTSGSPPYSFAWSFGDGSGGASGDFASHSYAFWGVFQANVTLTDSLGDTATDSVNVTVTPAPLVVTAQPSTSLVAVGGHVTLETSVTGGARPFTYAWSGLPPGCPNLGAENLTCQVTGAGQFNITVVVTDHLGSVNSASFPLLVTGGTSPAPPTDTSQGMLYLELIVGIGIVAALSGVLAGRWW